MSERPAAQRPENATNASLDLAQMRPPGFLRKMRDYEQKLIEKISVGGGWRANEFCLVCASPRRNPLWKAHDITLLKCLDCEHCYFEKMPRDLGEVYEGQDYLENSKTNYLANVDYRLRRFAAERLGILAQHKPLDQERTLLDVGCGTGWFLHAAKEAGYQSSGFEFSSALAKFTEQTVGCRVYDSDLRSIQSQFDVITLFDVIEHVPDPADTFRVVRQLLKPDGVAMVFCPNFDSLAIRAARNESNLVMPTRHLSYFTRRSVEKLCSVANMQLVWFKTAGIDLGDLMAWFETQGLQRDLPMWQRMSDTLQPLLDEFGIGNHLRFMATPLSGGK